MDAWAKKFAGRAAFVCVSCAGPDLAEKFGRELELRHCHNTWVADMLNAKPRWGQLGCSGFIVLDANGRVVCAKSAAFLEVREAAFAQVEAMLYQLLGELKDVDPATLSVRELKRLLRQQGVDYSACVEKREMVALLKKSEHVKAATAQFKRKRVEGDTGRVAPEAKSESEAAAPTLAVGPIASVLVPELDAEHEECAEMLEQLAARRDAVSLAAVLRAYEAHFNHEEQLLDTHLYGGGGSGGDGFSADAGARTSHYADHERLLQDVRDLMPGKDDDRDKFRVSAEDVRRVVRAFEQHAARYDDAYAERLSAQMRLTEMGRRQRGRCEDRGG